MSAAAGEKVASTSSLLVEGKSAKADAASSPIGMRRSAKYKDKEVEFDSNTVGSKYLS